MLLFSAWPSNCSAGYKDLWGLSPLAIPFVHPRPLLLPPRFSPFPIPPLTSCSWNVLGTHLPLCLCLFWWICLEMSPFPQLCPHASHQEKLPRSLYSEVQTHPLSRHFPTTPQHARSLFQEMPMRATAFPAPRTAACGCCAMPIMSLCWTAGQWHRRGRQPMEGSRISCCAENK